MSGEHARIAALYVASDERGGILADALGRAAGADDAALERARRKLSKHYGRPMTRADVLRERTKIACRAIVAAALGRVLAPADDAFFARVATTDTAVRDAVTIRQGAEVEAARVERALLEALSAARAFVAKDRTRGGRGQAARRLAEHLPRIDAAIRPHADMWWEPSGIALRTLGLPHEDAKPPQPRTMLARNRILLRKPDGTRLSTRELACVSILAGLWPERTADDSEPEEVLVAEEILIGRACRRHMSEAMLQRGERETADAQGVAATSRRSGPAPKP